MISPTPISPAAMIENLDGLNTSAYLLRRDIGILDALVVSSASGEFPLTHADMYQVSFSRERDVHLSCYYDASLTERILKNSTKYFLIVKEPSHRKVVVPFIAKEFPSTILDGHYTREIESLKRFVVENDPLHEHVEPTGNPFDPITHNYYPAGHCIKKEIIPRCSAFNDLYNELSGAFQEVQSPKPLPFFRRHIKDFLSVQGISDLELIR